MLRHEFQPGRLVGGVCLTVAGALYLGDVRGLWDIPWFTAIPLVVGGLFLAGVTTALTRAVRRKNSAEEEKAEPPARSSPPSGAHRSG
ncbi:hypothetical protein ABTZ78_23485 [Streptomyces bauhiniae]|uniref:hypothetical protein n=1 Tax=Streptomyces bauhiniae TaxID=2340725 RepID=UPI00331D1184